MTAIKVISIILWIIAIFSAGFGGLMFLGGMANVKSAPQEASLSAMSLVFTIVPYCIARGFDEIFKKNKFGEESNTNNASPYMRPQNNKPKTKEETMTEAQKRFLET